MIGELSFCRGRGHIATRRRNFYCYNDTIAARMRHIYDIRYAKVDNVMFEFHFLFPSARVAVSTAYLL